MSRAIEAILAAQYKEDADAWFRQWERTEWRKMKKARRGR